MLSDAEIVRRLRIIKHSPQHDRCARRTPSLNAIANAVSITRMQIYRIIRGDPLGPRSRSELNRVMTCNEMTGARSSVHRQ